MKKNDKQAFTRAIEDDYRVHWIVDNLPVGMYSTNQNYASPSFVRGFPVGFKVPTGKTFKYYLNNHVRIIIQYHDDFESSDLDEVTTKIVGFRVEPMSIKHTFEGSDFTPGTTVLQTCNAMTPPTNDPKNFFNVDKADSVIFTYDVFWEKSNTEWANRWDVYLSISNPDEQVHWFSITNAILVVLLLTVIIAYILLKALRRDIAKYNESAADEADESGWKLVHGDIFRPPSEYPMLFRYLLSLFSLS